MGASGIGETVQATDARRQRDLLTCVCEIANRRTLPLKPTIKRLCGKSATPCPEVEQRLAGAGYPPPATAKRPGHSEHLRVALASEQPHPSAKRSVPPAEPLRPPGRALRVVAPRWRASGHLQQAGKPYAVQRGRSAIRHVRLFTAEILPDLIARRTVDLFRPVAFAAVASVCMGVAYHCDASTAQ